MRFDFRVSTGPVSQASHDSGHGSHGGCSRAGYIFAARRAAAPEARAQMPGVGGWGLLATLMMIRVMIGRVRSARGCGCDLQVELCKFQLARGGRCSRPNTVMPVTVAAAAMSGRGQDERPRSTHSVLRSTVLLVIRL